MEFKNRKKELNELKEVLDSKKFELLIIYGRRRIGKTELILNATKDKKRIYYLGIGEKNLERFYNVCEAYNSQVSNLKKDFEVLLDYLKNKVDVIVIDEFQNLIKENKEILNIFQSAVDTKLKNSKLKLILLGSSVSIITSKVLSYQSPLYGRRSGSIRLKPISFFDLKEFFPELSIEQLVEIYGFAGGIPYYLIKLNSDIWTWLSKEIKQERSFLRDEVDFLMRYEFDDPSTYKLILEAIANGKNKINEIKNYIKVERTDISPYIKNLLEVDLIKREVPVTENLKSRSGRYFLKDNFLNFWFRFIYPNLSSIESMIFKTSTIKDNYSEYLGGIFENICIEFLAESKIFNFSKIGRWWYKDNEIDIVALNNEKKEVLFGECKWKNKVDAEKILEQLKGKAVNVEWPSKYEKEDKKEFYIIFAKSFKKRVNQENVYCIDINDIGKL